MAQYFFDEFQLDSESGLLQGPEGRLELRAKTRDLLVFLITNQGRLLSKQELLESLWPERAVVENVLVQSIREIRNALGDDARHPRFLKNYPRKGYQWLMPVTIETEGPNPSPPIHATNESAIVERVVENEADVQVSKAPVIGKRILVISAAALVLLAVIAWFFVDRRKPIASASLTEPGTLTRLTILPFANLTGDTQLNWIPLGLMDMFSQSLDQVPSLQVLSEKDVFGEQGYNMAPEPAMESPSWESHVDFLLQVQIYKEPKGFLLRGLLTGHEMHQITLEVREAKLFAATQALLSRTVSVLDAAPMETSLRGVFSSDEEALRDYAVGMQEIRSNGASMARLYFEAALKRDPDFDYARFRRAWCDFRLSHFQRATEDVSLLMSRSLAPNLKVSVLWLKALIARDSGHTDEGVALFRELLSQADLHGNLQGRVIAHQGLGNMAMTSGRFEEAKLHFERVLELNQKRGSRLSEAHALGALANVMARLENYPEAKSLYERSIEIHREMGDKPGVADSLCNLGIVFCFQERLSEAETIFEQALKLFEELGNTPGMADVLLNLGSVAQQDGRWEAALTYYLRAEPIFEGLEDPSGKALIAMSLADAYAHTDALEKAQPFLERASRYYEEHPEQYGVFEYLVIKAFIAHKRGDHQRAVSLMEQAREQPHAIWNDQHEASLRTYRDLL